jgi:hypothetical protein
MLLARLHPVQAERQWERRVRRARWPFPERLVLLEHREPQRLALLAPVAKVVARRRVR